MQKALPNIRGRIDSLKVRLKLLKIGDESGTWRVRQKESEHGQCCVRLLIDVIKDSNDELNKRVGPGGSLGLRE